MILNFSIDYQGETLCFFRKIIATQIANPFSLVRNSKLFPKFYLKDRSSIEQRVALGSIAKFESIPDLSKNQDQFFLYGTYPFPKNAKSNIWGELAKPFFFIPKWELIINSQGSTLYYYGKSEEPPYPEPGLENNDTQWSPLIYQYYDTRSDVPNLALWEKAVSHSLDLISKSYLQKLVLARQTSLFSKTPFCPYSLLDHLLKQQQNTAVFLFQMSEDVSFLGSTPEQLYERSNQSLFTEALAGTLPRGQDEFEDQQLASRLLNSPKESSEVRYVEEFIKAQLSPLSYSIETDPIFSIIKTPKVQHLYKKISCKLNESNSDEMLTNYLHPTPAVAGLPQNTALALLKKIELFERGLYAGFLGWTSKSQCRFYVGIRSALIQSNELHLFAGTGIVEGSSSEKEWEELEYKISQFKEVLHAR
ncbi:MAG: isochorismate synthase [Chlamydiae bacterium]|nr:isochorismate synthase [Chlamydiota bacterium]